MKILLFGKSGQVGWELQRSLAPLGELVALDRHGDIHLCGDLSDPDGLVRTIRSVAPDVIVNAAAYTAVDNAEHEPGHVQTINALAPGLMAREACAIDAWLVHYSTDYVFDGSGSRPWREDDATAPLNVYGKTKREGEEAIRDSGCKHLVFRTSWVYGTRGRNFPRNLLARAAEQEVLSVVDDQIGAPASAELIADVTAHALRMAMQSPALGGLYHLTASGEVSWCDYAHFLMAEARRMGMVLKAKTIEPVTTIERPVVARRPLNSRLDCSRIQQSFNLYLPPWQQGVSRWLEESRLIAQEPSSCR
ncbi:MAG TPA: dTDP-4-dehydrorhamnose reductase [Candidatus Kapabacteria bacterium]|nr:dTDP-4-dehydrorhamnose reductase [Candidatus Kapabacteria bacterium]